MRMVAVTALAAMVTLGGCGDKAATGNASAAASGGKPAGPVQRQPGSWSSKIEITRLEAGDGIDTTQMRRGMQTAMDGASRISLCVTPEAAARGSGAEIQQMAQGRNCKFDRQVQDGERLDFAGICEDQRGQKIRVSLSGTSGATAQDLTMAMQPAEASAGGLRAMEMRVRSTRNGDCKPGDVTPPIPAKQ